jgi:5'-nucleotidase
MYGTVLVCTQNLAISGANQVLLNILNGGFFEGVVVVLSPSDGPLRGTFEAAGAAVRIGNLENALSQLRDVRLALCNTVMTAPQVIELAARRIPHMWILHEWWPKGILAEELAARNITFMNEDTVNQALRVCHRCICVCNAQTQIYDINCPKSVVFVGVPEASNEDQLRIDVPKDQSVTTFLCMGIVCPRKNQHTTVRLFKKFAENRTDVKLIVVGARYIRDFEIEYIQKVKAEIAGDSRIELHDVTSDPASYYRQADVLLFNSVNEVTPLVLPEAMLHGVPVITTNIAGIPEMIKHQEHGFALDPDDDEGFVSAMQKLADAPLFRAKLGEAGKKHSKAHFTLDAMVDNYARVARELAPIVVLLDMDGTVVDWDTGFRQAWADRSTIDRTKSYAMEDCVPAEFKEEAKQVMMSPGFFRHLPPFPNALEAVKKMEQAGFQIWFCTSPLLGHPTCCQEKLEWVQEHFGLEYVKRVILCQDKTTVRGDILVDDKPSITGLHPPTWQQCIFDAPYNQARTDLSRMTEWSDWEIPLMKVLESSGMKRIPSLESSGMKRIPSDLKKYADGLKDFSEDLKAMGVYLSDYANWRQGSTKGAKGEPTALLRHVQDACMIEATLRDAEEPDDIFCFRRDYRAWRQGRAKGCKPIL